MTPRAARLLRGTLLGFVATLLAALSHSWSGGTVPSPLALVLGAGFAGAVGTIAVGRRSRISLPRTVIGVGAAQLAFHLGFSLLGTDATVTASGSHHHMMFAISADPSTAVAQGGLAMWVGHLTAGVLTVLYLRRLERHVWALLQHLGGIVVRSLSVRPWLPARRMRAPIDSPALVAVSSLWDPIARRGPPALLPA